MSLLSSFALPLQGMHLNMLAVSNEAACEMKPYENAMLFLRLKLFL